LRGFAGIALSRDAVPDATTLLKFRHWLERRELTRVLFDEVRAVPAERGLSSGTAASPTVWRRGPDRLG
jgi:IS5 family transposase